MKKFIENEVYYRMKEDESALDVAEKFNTSIDNISFLSVEEHRAGEFVKIHAPNSSTYIVRPLDNLKSVAKKLSVSVDELISRNNLKSSRLFIGQKLRY